MGGLYYLYPFVCFSRNCKLYFVFVSKIPKLFVKWWRSSKENVRASSIGLLQSDGNNNSNSRVGLYEELNLWPNGSVIPPNFTASTYLLLWPAFLNILQSLEICLILWNLVSMAAMIKSSRTLKEKNFSNDKERRVCCSILHIS
jgi:hypothetical protein